MIMVINMENKETKKFGIRKLKTSSLELLNWKFVIVHRFCKGQKPEQIEPVLFCSILKTIGVTLTLTLTLTLKEIDRYKGIFKWRVCHVG
jgi:hypothetical protein